MKKVLMTILVALLSMPIFSQEQQVVYGVVRTDGFSKITKGAFWSKRPEAKMIYEGSYPPDYTVIYLKEEYYVRFTDSEHNNFDGNYIVFPRGEKIYRNNTTGAYFAAVCGNEIEYLCPVNRVIIQKETQIVEVEKIVEAEKSTTEASTPVVINNYSYPEEKEVVYYSDNYRYYEPYYSNGLMDGWNMLEYYIWDGIWRRASYSAYCNWDSRNRRCDNLGRYNHRTPPADVRHREHRPHHENEGGPGGSKPNHDTGGGPGGSGRNNEGGPGGAGRNYDGGSGGSVSRSNSNSSSYGSYSRSNSGNTNTYNRGTSSRQSSSYSRGSTPSRMNNAFGAPNSRSSYSRGSSASFRGSSNSSFSRGSSGMSRSSSSRQGGTAFRR